jgi:CRP/FNR family cyclic AMP-dependent transcriptional regulator
MRSRETPYQYPHSVLSEPPPSCETGGEESRRRSIRILISQQRFFDGFSESHLNLFADAALEVSFEAGESIMEEGSPANRLYLILEGKVVLGAELEDRGIVPVQMLGPGDDLGWSWLFPPYHMHLSARALSPVKALFIYGNRLREEADKDHEFGYQLMTRVTDVVMQRLRATQQRLVECASMRTLFNS